LNQNSASDSQAPAFLKEPLSSQPTRRRCIESKLISNQSSREKIVKCKSNVSSFLQSDTALHAKILMLN
jgi:hypothetical protein